jgi:hypothetical protein
VYDRGKKVWVKRDSDSEMLTQNVKKIQSINTLPNV